MNTPTTTPATTAAPKQKTLCTIDGVLASDIEIRSANTQSGPKPFAYGKITGKNGKTHTINTYVHKGIEILTGLKAGDSVRIFGTFEQQDKGRTFSAMGLSIPKVKETPAAEVANEAALVEA